MNKSTISKSGLYLFCFLMLLSGCRFGNFSDSAKPIPSKLNLVDKEYFATETKSFEVSATFLDANGVSKTTQNLQTPLSAIPSKILAVFTTPLLYANVLDTTTQTKFPIFANFDVDSYYETKTVNERDIAYQFNSGTYKFMYNSACTTSSEILMDGILDRTTPTTLNMGDGNLLNISGRNKMTFTYSRRFDGDCADDLYILAYCYSNGAQCNNDELRFSHNILDLHVNQSGALKINDALKLKSLEYKVHFE